MCPRRHARRSAACERALQTRQPAPRRRHAAYAPLLTHAAARRNHTQGTGRLGRALEAAEAEVDAAAARSVEVQRSLLRQRDAEICELRRALEAKDRALAALRETAGAARHGYEQQLAAAEGAAAGREAEVGALKACMRAAWLSAVHGYEQQLAAAEGAAAGRDAEVCTYRILPCTSIMQHAPRSMQQGTHPHQ